MAPERFFWAVLDDVPPVWRRSGEVAPGLLATLGEHLPAPIDDLHAIGLTVDGGRLLVCAALRAELDEVKDGITMLSPSAIPEEVAVCVEPGIMNLLVGSCTPRAIIHARRKRTVAAMMVFIAALMLVHVGLSRRSANLAAAEASLTTATKEVFSDLALAGPDPAAALAREITTLKQLVEAERTSRPQGRSDPVVALASLLAAWPVDSGAEPQDVNVTDTTATVTTRVVGNPRIFLGSLSSPPGWMLEEPRLNTSGDTTLVSLQLRSMKGNRP